MKANKKFREADDAVSPVIGVILMVAITVVLAAVVFVLVSDLGGESSSAPAMSFTVSETDDKATVSSAASGTTWDEFELRFSADGGFTINGDAHGGTHTDAAANTNVPTGSTAVVSGGDFIEFCADDTTTTLEVTLRHIDSNSVVRTFSFQSAAAC